MNKGTRTVAPDSTVAGFSVLVAVSPFIPWFCISNLHLNFDRHVCIKYSFGRSVRNNVQHCTFEQEVYTIDQVVSDGVLVKKFPGS